ncbi:hypothetical protein LI328DRAFT_17758 [Trichoderma asperelloides]|nr:hypothetical protein LI328DRAFT_17758 [Trichoderma asperelloides]
MKLAAFLVPLRGESDLDSKSASCLCCPRGRFHWQVARSASRSSARNSFSLLLFSPTSSGAPPVILMEQHQFLWCLCPR